MGRAAASLMQQIFTASQSHGVSHFVCCGFAGLGDAHECDLDIPFPQPKIQGAVHTVTAFLWGSIVPGSVRLCEGVCSPCPAFCRAPGAGESRCCNETFHQEASGAAQHTAQHWRCCSQELPSPPGRGPTSCSGTKATRNSFLNTSDEIYAFSPSLDF